MADQFRSPGGQAWGYLPQATGQIVGYIRDPKRFRINRWAQKIPTKSPTANYFYIDPDQPVRIYNRAEFIFPDGGERPTGNWNLTAGQWLPFVCQRFDIPWTLGNDAIETAREFSGFDPAQVEQQQVASQAMTLRTSDAISVLETAANWGANTADANVVNGGYGNWANASDDPASPFYLAIRKTFTNVMKIVTLGTNSVVRFSDMVCVLSPGAAIMMANTAEIYNYVKYGMFSKPHQEGEDVEVDEQWGLPKRYAGIEIVVEDAPHVIVQPNSSGTLATITSGNRAFAKADTSAVFMTRQGGIEAPYGTKNFSTFQIYFYKHDMSVWEYADPRNLRTEGHVMDYRAQVLAAPASGFLVTSIM